jgi:hypothetical protein
MATIDQVKKQYGKLTARERFALVVAAGAREDETERRALMAAAPKVTFSFPHTQGLADGFQFLTSWHLIQQLGTAGTLFMLIHFEDDNPLVTNKIDGMEYSLMDAIELNARRFMEGLEAYRAICAEYGIDPETLTDAYSSYPELREMAELIILRFHADDPLELTDLEATKETYRQVIESQRAAWSEAKAR